MDWVVLERVMLRESLCNDPWFGKAPFGKQVPLRINAFQARLQCFD